MCIFTQRLLKNALFYPCVLHRECAIVRCVHYDDGYELLCAQRIFRLVLFCTVYIATFDRGRIRDNVVILCYSPDSSIELGKFTMDVRGCSAIVIALAVECAIISRKLQCSVSGRVCDNLPVR